MMQLLTLYLHCMQHTHTHTQCSKHTHNTHICWRLHRAVLKRQMAQPRAQDVRSARANKKRCHASADALNTIKHIDGGRCSFLLFAAFFFFRVATPLASKGDNSLVLHLERLYLNSDLMLF